MISFLTLFLGLIAGEHAVEVSVAGPVAAVVFELDGARVARVEAPPWKAVVDFGKELAPHEVVARAYDEGGHEMGQARQMVNLPRQPAEIEVLVEKDALGSVRRATLAPDSLVASRPTSVAVTFDGHTLPMAPGALSVDLPAYDVETTHLLSVIARFPSSLQSRRDLVVGGAASGEARSALTALPVRLKSAEPPTVATLSHTFVKDGQPLVPVAVEHGAAQLLIVRDLSADEAISRLGSGAKTLFDAARLGTSPIYDPEAMRQQMRLDDEDRIRFIWPRAAVSAAKTPTELFENSHDFSPKDGGLHWLLTRVYHPAKGESNLRFADAVAVAGLQAFQSYNRRAVLLVIGAKSKDTSLYDPATVIGYLQRINVPLYVWSLVEPSKRGSGGWSNVADVSSAAKMRPAFDRLKEDLDSQWIVWFSGEYRPAAITVAPGASDVEIVR
ncbi:MAG TPA: hypothetical protein VJA66_11730 [Thermoanaerobaculia bacterium]